MGTDGDRVQERGFGASWVFSAMAKVNSGFQSVVDRVWHWWSRAPYYFQMDTLSTLLFGWLIFGVLVVLLAKFLYDKFIREDSDFADEDLQNSHSDDRNEPKLPTGGCLGPPPKISKKPTIVPDGPPDRISPPIATGGDPDAIRWINNLLVWFYEGSEGGPVLRNSWNDVLNEYTVGVALETGVLVEILEFFPQTPAPCLYNVIVDCGPTDDMTITCDLEQTLYLRVQTTRTQRDVTTESEYACAVRPLRGRLNIALQTYKCRTHAKFDGWPEVTMELEGIRNNATGLDEQQLQDVVMEVLTAALRKVCLDIDFTQKRTFPRFSRARSVPDRVMPVGYDALVREVQTHPPSYIPMSATSIISVSTNVAATSKDINVVKTAMGIPILYSSLDDSGYANSNASDSSGPVTATVTMTSKSLMPPLSDIYSNMSSISDEENIEEAGESFSAMSFATRERSPHEATSHPAKQSITNGSMPSHDTLTVSEESLIARNLEQYDRSNSLPDIDLHQLLEKYSRIAEENFLEEVKAHVKDTTSSTQSGRSKDQEADYVPSILESGYVAPKRTSLIFSSREKPIDEYEPNESLTDEDDSCLKDLNSFTHERPPLKGALKHINEKRPKSPGESPPKSPHNSFRSEMDKMREALSNTYNLPSARPSLFHQPHSASSAASVGIIGLNGKRLLVKVVKASGIGGELGVSQTYAVIEMDEPPQKFTTAPINDSTSPFWDEQFLFDLSDNTLELLFELYDKKDKRFLGLGIVGIEELVATPSQRQIIPLQSRPCENDHVSGSLTCEFLFLDRADLPDLTLRAGSGITSQSGGRFTPTNSSYEKPSDDDFSEGGNNFGAEASALKGFEGRHSGPLSQAMPIARPIIQASRKPMHDPRLENPAGVSNSRDSGLPSFNSSSVPQVITSGPSNYSTSVDQASFTAESSTNTSTEININGSDADERSRSRNRLKTDFFGSLRRRFSRSKVRSKSVDPTSPAGIDMTLDRDPPGGRSVSVERSSRVIRSRGLLTVPTGMRKSSTGNLGGDTGSTRSSLSGTSGLSSASTRTYINEASLLVVETLENGIIKHYLVPLSLQRKNKWRKKGTKLHIFNEHIFVAKHMSSSILCHVCNKTLGRRFGKQGYECRDCSFKCHKPCHIKTDIVCPNSTINSMDLVYVKDEKAERKKGLRIS